VVIGHGLGGTVALSLAEAQPSLVGPIVIVDSVPFLGGMSSPETTPEMAAKQSDAMHQDMLTATPEQRNAYARSLLASMISDPAKVDVAVQWYSQSDPRTVANSFSDLLSIDLRPELDRIDVPVLVFGTWIAHKQFATREQVEQTFRRQYSGLRDWRLVLLDRARHFVMWDDPQTMFKQTDEFLASASKRIIAAR
jgi:pimeloyl-ACP methyl ester carboxylesterase